MNAGTEGGNMGNEQRRPYEPDPKRDQQHGSTGQRQTEQQGPNNPVPGTGADRERMDRDRSRSGGTSNPNRGTNDRDPE
jgi:hypothetical protein